MSNTRALWLLIPLLAGCKVGPDYKQPSFALPESWFTDTKTQPAETPAPIPLDWWKDYHDPVLTSLIEEGAANNADLLTAAARVSEASAVLGYDQAQLYPEIDVQANATRTRNSSRASFGGFTPSTRAYNDFGIAAVLNYELDLWGKLRRATEADRAQLLGAKANRDAIRIAVAANIAQSYFNLRAIDDQIAVTKNTITARKGELDYQSKQYHYGAADGLTLSQAQSELAVAENALPVLTQARQEQNSALIILLGREPKSVVLDTLSADKGFADLPVPPVLPADAPATLLERRPDITNAEQQLIAANAGIGVAKANYFPTISLSYLFGLEAAEIGNVINSSAHHWQAGATLAGPLIDFGRTASEVDQAKAQRDVALVNYKQAVRTAFKEVVDAMSGTRTSADRVAATQKQVRALKEALRIANLRYKEGYSEYLDLLDAERNLYDAQLTEITAERDQLIASVTLYKALGGGWRPEDIEEAKEPKPVEAPAPAAKPAEPAATPKS